MRAKPSSRAIKSVQLTSSHLRAVVISQGASLKSLVLRREGKPDLPLIWDRGHVSAYLNNPEHAGSIAGRVAGRIAGGQFKIRGRRVQLETNEGPNTLHGGPVGFGQINWRWAGGSNFSLSSPNGDQGFPGRVEVTARYSLPNPFILRLDLTAKAHQTTPINLTHHPYWRRFGAELSVAGNQFQTAGRDLIPSGGTSPFSADLSQSLDHCVQLEGEGLRQVAALDQREEGFGMQVWSDATHLQVYNGQAGYVCLEPQSANDAVNQDDVPSILFNPGKLWTRRIEYRFLI